MTTRPVIAILLICVMAGCQSRQSSAPVASKSRIERVSFIYKPGNDIGPSFTHRIDIVGTSGHYTLWRGDRKVVEKDARFEVSDTFRGDLEATVVGVPAGYWGRKIDYDPKVDGGLVYRTYAPRFIIVATFRDAAEKQIEADGLDDRLSTIFRLVQAGIPRRMRFELPQIEFWVSDEDASGNFTWKLISQR